MRTNHWHSLILVGLAATLMACGATSSEEPESDDGQTSDSTSHTGDGSLTGPPTLGDTGTATGSDTDETDSEVSFMVDFLDTGGTGQDTASTPDTASTQDTGTITSTMQDTSQMDAGDMFPPSPTTDRESVNGMCQRWSFDRQYRSEGTFDGDLDACVAGTPDPESHSNTLRQVNLFRWLARQPAVTLDPARNDAALDCALIQAANWRTRGLSHSPPESFDCYSDRGASAAGVSNISGGSGVNSIDMYMMDRGNTDTLGHRRWLLSNGLGPIGTGSTPDGSCLWVIGGSGNGGQSWIAWPPPGVFPIQANSMGFDTLDNTGWSIQSPGIGLSNAMVTVTGPDGLDRPVDVSTLSYNIEGNAIRIAPNGWGLELGNYTVDVTGISSPISYTIEVVDCG